MRMVLAKNWWSLVIRGVAGILMGLVTVFWPGITLAARVIVFGAYSLVDGVFSMVGAVRALQSHERWGALVFSGIAGIAAGLVTFFWPAITAGAGLRYRRMGGVIALWVGAYALVSGVLLVLLGFRLRSWERWHVAGTGIPLPAH